MRQATYYCAMDISMHVVQKRRFSSNSEAFASELLENEKCLELSWKNEASVYKSASFYTFQN